MSEEDVIKRRLVIDGEGTGDNRRMTIVIKMIAKWIKSSKLTEAESQAMFDKILVLLSLIEQSRRRSDQVRKSTEEELVKYKTLYDELELKIYLKKQEIIDQKKELQNAKKVKKNRIQRNLLAQLVAEEPPRTVSRTNIKVLHEELANLAGQKVKLENQIAKRKKEFSVLSRSTNTLSELVDSDFEEALTNSDNAGASTFGPDPTSK